MSNTNNSQKNNQETKQDLILEIEKKIQNINRLQHGVDPSTVWEQLTKVIAQYSAHPQISSSDIMTLLQTANEDLLKIADKRIDEKDLHEPEQERGESSINLFGLPTTNDDAENAKNFLTLLMDIINSDMDEEVKKEEINKNCSEYLGNNKSDLESSLKENVGNEAFNQIREIILNITKNNPNNDKQSFTDKIFDQNNSRNGGISR